MFITCSLSAESELCSGFQAQRAALTRALPFSWKRTERSQVAVSDSAQTEHVTSTPNSLTRKSHVSKPDAHRVQGEFSQRDRPSEKDQQVFW